MSNVKLCPNGHYYSDAEAECPYCPKAHGPRSMAEGATIPAAGQDFGSGGKTQVFSQSPPPTNSDSGKTQIMNSPASLPGQQPVPGGGRKLVAWLVTYDANPLGRDYRIYEGRNTVGHAREREVVVDYDSKVSNHHLTLLYRLGTFHFKDELSTNGTFLNGVLADEGTLKDGDQLRIGDTTFLFRTAIQ